MVVAICPIRFHLEVKKYDIHLQTSSICCHPVLQQHDIMDDGIVRNGTCM